MSSLRRPSPAGAIARGIAAGVAETAVMTGCQTAVAKLRGREPSTTPAEVGKRIVRGVFQRRVDEQHTTAINNAMHWAYGTGWGAAYALTDGVDAPALSRGLASACSSGAPACSSCPR